MSLDEELRRVTIPAIELRWQAYEDYLREKSILEVRDIARAFFAYGYMNAIADISPLDDDEYELLDNDVNAWLDAMENRDG